MTKMLGAAAVAEPATDLEQSGVPSAAPATSTFYVAVGGNDWYWRASAPAEAIGGKVITIDEKSQPIRGKGGRFAGRTPGITTAITQPAKPTRKSGFRWDLLQDRNDPDYYETRYPDHEGNAAVWIRPDPPRSVHAEQMRDQGIVTISEVDDNYLANPRLNIFQRHSGFNAKDQWQHLRSMASMERMVFSTEWLRDYYAKSIRKVLKFKRSEMPEMFVCRNNVDEKDWPEPVERTGPLRVGWMGSPSHIWDVDLAWNALLHASRLGCETYMIGYNPADPDEGRFPDEMRSARSRHKIKQWKRVGYRHIKWIKPQDYHRAALPLDIGLAPVKHNMNTAGKSDVKFLEYSMSGAATIAWNNPIYQTIEHGETGLLVGSDREAMAAVERLVRDSALRERLVANARAYVREERGLKQLKSEWGAAIG